MINSNMFSVFLLVEIALVAISLGITAKVTKSVGVNVNYELYDYNYDYDNSNDNYVDKLYGELAILLLLLVSYLLRILANLIYVLKARNKTNSGAIKHQLRKFQTFQWVMLILIFAIGLPTWVVYGNITSISDGEIPGIVAGAIAMWALVVISSIAGIVLAWQTLKKLQQQNEKQNDNLEDSIKNHQIFTQPQYVLPQQYVGQLPMHSQPQQQHSQTPHFAQPINQQFVQSAYQQATPDQIPTQNGWSLYPTR